MPKTAAAVTGFVAKLRMLFLTYVGVIIKIFSYGWKRYFIEFLILVGLEVNSQKL